MMSFLKGAPKLVAPKIFRVEKYRPMVLEDIVGNAEAVDRMTAIASQGNMPNLIFSVCELFVWALPHAAVASAGSNAVLTCAVYCVCPSGAAWLRQNN